MLFSNRYETIEEYVDIDLNNNRISVELLGEFLGLIIDSNVKFTNHIDIICNNISRSIGIFHKLKDFVSHNILLNLYYSLVYPYLLYGNLIWGGTCEYRLIPLQLLQRKLVRIITYSDYLAHVAPLFKQTNIHKIADLHKYLLSIHMYKLRQSNDPVFESMHEYSTRQQGEAHVTFQRLSMTQRSMSYAAPMAWNALPRVVRDCESFSLFKKQLKSFYINSYV